ncbi:MAG: FkbM family methyltransferase [Caldilineaceae bacterium]|nr:FkbM family methyltransferase [Caldilineaceae bacterium]
MAMQVRVLARKLRYRLSKLMGQIPNLQIEYQCNKSLRIGSDYGGWYICPEFLGKTSVVYSIGVGTDISFDLGMIEHFGVTVHAFDPTPKSIAWVKMQKLPPEFVLHEIGLAHYNGTAQFYTPRDEHNVSHSIVRQDNVGQAAIEVQVARLNTLMKKLGHNEIDLLKMDVEGAEYAIIDSILQEKIPIRQLLVEFHHRLIADGAAQTLEAVKKLRREGYRLFAVADSSEECSFLRAD